jgi:hypothetical protein
VGPLLQNQVLEIGHQWIISRHAQQACSNNAGAGALIGGAAGAIAGSQMSARGRHTENSLMGGVAGALLGSVIGRSTNNCGNYNSGYYDNSYNNGYYDNGYNNGYHYGHSIICNTTDTL